MVVECHSTVAAAAVDYHSTVAVAVADLLEEGAVGALALLLPLLHVPLYALPGRPDGARAAAQSCRYGK